MSNGHRARRAATVALAGLALLGLAGCGAQASGAIIHRAPTATPTQGPGPTLTTPTTAQALTASAQGAVGAAASAVAVTYDPSSQQASVTLTITGDVPTTDARIAAAIARAQTLTFQEENDLWSTGLPVSAVIVTVMGPAQDPYDGIINQVYSVATVSAATARRIPWASATPQSAWALYDSTFLRPGFVVQDHTLPDATATPGG
jgi:hypothetical protein